MNACCRRVPILLASGPHATTEPLSAYLCDVGSRDQRKGRDGVEHDVSTLDLRQLLPNLSMCLYNIGRSETQGELHCSRNSVASNLVRTLVEIAKRSQHTNGVRKRSAVPVNIGIVGVLPQHFDVCACCFWPQDMCVCVLV